MNTTTIRAIIPTEIKHRMDQAIAMGEFPSVHDLVSRALTTVLPQVKRRRPRLTVNGFTPEFEDVVLASSKLPADTDTVIETDEDLERYFDRIMKEVEKKRHAHQAKQ